MTVRLISTPHSLYPKLDDVKSITDYFRSLSTEFTLSVLLGLIYRLRNLNVRNRIGFYKFLTTAMDEFSYAEALDALTFNEHTTCIHYYDSNQEVQGYPEFSWESANGLKCKLQEAFPSSAHQVSENQTVVKGEKAKLKLLIGLGGGGSNGRLFIGKDCFKQIMIDHGFPKVFAETIRSNNGSFACFLDHAKVEDKVSSSFLSVVIHTPYAPAGNFSFVMRINIFDCSATGLYFHRDMFNDAGIASLLKRLHGHRRLLGVNPLALLGILMEEYGRTCERDRTCNDMNVVAMEGQTGMTSLLIAPRQVATGYELLTKALHSCNTNLIFLDNMTNFEVAIGTFIKETLIKFQTLREMRLLETISVEVDDALMQNIEYLLNAATMRRYQAQSLHRRTQSQINVLYSMISQRDSNINISIAEDSKKIAAATKRDSLAMKTIAILTLIFLPGTFVAAIFDTGMFHFERAAINVVSDQWLVYFVVSGLLTIVPIVVWIVYMRWRGSGIREKEEKLE